MVMEAHKLFQKRQKKQQWEREFNIRKVLGLTERGMLGNNA